MKRTLVIVLVLLFLFSGCAGEQKESSLDSDRNFLHYGRFLEACSTRDTLYFVTGDLVHYYDKASGVSGVLCGKAECEHNTSEGSDCNAYIGSISQDFCLYGGRLFWQKMDGTTVTVSSMALDGTDHRVDRVISRAGLFEGSNGGYGMLLHRGCLYLWIKNNVVVDGEQVTCMDVAVTHLEGEEAPVVIFSRELTPYATAWNSEITLQAYGDDLYILTTLARCCTWKEDGYPDVYDFQVQRYDSQSGDLTTIYHEEEARIDYTVELWVKDDGIVFIGMEHDENGGYGNSYFLSFETGQVEKIQDRFGLIADNLIASCNYEFQAKNPTNPWGLSLSPQDWEKTGTFHVTLRNFAGELLVDADYLLEGDVSYPRFIGRDETYAYFFSESNHSDNVGLERVMTLLGVALDGSGMKILCSEKEYYQYPGSDRGTESSRTLDDGTEIYIKNNKWITVTPGDGSPGFSMSIAEFLEKGYDAVMEEARRTAEGF